MTRSTAEKWPLANRSGISTNKAGVLPAHHSRNLATRASGGFHDLLVGQARQGPQIGVKLDKRAAVGALVNPTGFPVVDAGDGLGVLRAYFSDYYQRRVAVGGSDVAVGLAGL